MNGPDRVRKRLVVLVSGRGTNLQAIIEAIERNEIRAVVEAVISDRPDALALERAKQYGIPAIALDFASFGGSEAYHAALLHELETIAPALIVLSGSMRILPADVVRPFPWRLVNIHSSIFPAFPVLRSHKQELEYGVKVSGCTVHFVDEGMDTGPIIAQSVVAVHDDDDEHSLSQRILQKEHELYPQVIAAILQGQVLLDGRR